MVLVHFMYDLQAAGYAAACPFLEHLGRWGGGAFLLLSGLCVTLGRRHLRRGLTVLLCGLICTAVTGTLAALGFLDSGSVIWFGVLHCLGCCMLLWRFFSRLPAWALGLVGSLLILLGLWADTVRVNFPWLILLGLRTPGFASGDYFPLLFNLGLFLLGSCLGKLLYRDKTSLFPGVSPSAPPIRFFTFWGRHSLLVYLLHQPLLAAGFMLAEVLDR